MTHTIAGGTHRLADLADENGMIIDLVAEDAVFTGPVVLYIIDRLNLDDDSTVDDGGGGPEALVWEIDPARSLIVGAIGLQNASFARCGFHQVGWAVTRDYAHTLFSRFRVGPSR